MVQHALNVNGLSRLSQFMNDMILESQYITDVEDKKHLNVKMGLMSGWKITSLEGTRIGYIIEMFMRKRLNIEADIQNTLV